MWQFVVEVIDKNLKQMFDAQTDMEWLEFQDKVHSRLDKPHSNVQLVYRIGETGAMSYLANESDWDIAMCQLRGKIRAARTRPVLMEIRNVVSDILEMKNKNCTHVHCSQHESANGNGSKTRGPGKGKGKGKEKHRREDDVPPEPDPETKYQVECLDVLKKHLECEEHSTPGERVHCWVDPTGHRRSHSPLGNRELTNWAKHMVSTE